MPNPVKSLGYIKCHSSSKLWHLIYPRFLTGCARFLTGYAMLVFFTNLSLMEFLVRYLALFLIFSVIDGYEWFWMESLHRNIQLLMEFLKAPFLVLHFSYYTLMTFLTMLSEILLAIKVILLSVLSVIRYLICGINLNWLLNLNLIYKTLWAGVKSNSNGSVDVKMDGSVLEDKSSFKMLALNFSSKLNRGSYIISTAKTTSKKI